MSTGTTKPSCKVEDFSDLRQAKAAFEREFYSKSNNSWSAGPDAFRTFPYPAYNLVDDSEDEEASESDEEAEFADCEGARLWNLDVQGLVKRLAGRQALNEQVRKMQVDVAKLPLRQLKRRRMHTALSHLADMQKLLVSTCGSSPLPACCLACLPAGRSLCWSLVLGSLAPHLPCLCISTAHAQLPLCVCACACSRA